MGLIGSIALTRRDRTSPPQRGEPIVSDGWSAFRPAQPDCPFCPHRLDRSTAVHDEMLFRDRLISVLPDVSPLCAGHLLAGSRQHVLSMAELGPPALEHIAETLTSLCAKLTPEFGDYFIFEHGTPPEDGSRGACIDHAHIHMFPMETQMFDRLTSALDWEPIPEFKSLAAFRKSGYAYLGIKGSHYACPNPDIGSQWIRRQVCAALDRDDWDWALTKSDADLRATLARPARTRPPLRVTSVPAPTPSYMSREQRIPKLPAVLASSRTAQAKIVAKCQRGMVHPAGHADVWAWGQFLEIRGRTVQQLLGNQYGIYGTSAAVQMLAMQSARQGVTQTSRLEPEALSGSTVLPLVLSNPSSQYAPLHEHFINKQDLLVTFKLASLLDAANCLEAIRLPNGYSVDKTALVNRLLDIRRPGQGWPDYKSDRAWQGPNTHATAVAALALSHRAVPAEAQAACHEALAWFYDSEPLEKQSIATLSMIVMALAGNNRDSNSRQKPAELAQLRTACERLVRQWISDNAPGEVQRSLEGTEYWLPPGSVAPQSVGGSHFTYLFYLPHALVALAILASPRLRRSYSARRFTLLVIDYVTREINQQGCFIAAGRSMVSTVEHLWLYRLLHEFEDKGLYPHKIVAAIDRIRSFARRRWFTTTLGLLLVAGLAVAAAVTKDSTQVALGAISATVAAFVTTVVVTFWSRTWWGE